MFLVDTKAGRMQQRFDHQPILFHTVSLRHRGSPWLRSIVVVGMLALAAACKVHAQQAPPAAGASIAPAPSGDCLPNGDGYLRARLSGSLRMELAWGNDGTVCTGAVRPTDGGIRMRFSRVEQDRNPAVDGKLVLVFGIATLREGQSAKTVPVNVTVIREGHGEFYSTQGDDKCMLDDVTQQPIAGVPRRSRSYRIIARGFCTEPARAVRGQGAVLLSRFDFAGRVDFESEDTEDDTALAKGAR